MKRFFLPVLSWTLAMGSIFAQNQLPPSIQPYAINWGYTVKQMFEAAGIDVPGPGAEVDLVPMISNRSNELQLDSTILYYGYDGHASDSTPLFRNVYTYPDPAIQVIIEDYYDVDHWITLGRTTLIYDELGRIVETFSQLYDMESGEYTPDSRIELFPRDNSPELIDSFFVYNWSTEINDWVRQLGTWNTFDTQNRLFESLTSYEVFQVPALFLDRYTYNTDGDLMQIESFNLEGEEEISASKQEFWYEDHLLKVATTSTANGEQGFIAESKTVYRYTDFDEPELISVFEYDFSAGDWKLNQVFGYIYDDEHRVEILETSTLTAEGAWTRHRTSSAYVQDEYLATAKGFSYDNNLEDWVLEDTKYYYYSELSADDPLEPVAEALFMWPNPTSGIVEVRLVGQVSIYVYSLSGQLLSQYRMPPGQRTLDLTALPAGLYQVRAKSDEDYFSGKLIIQ